MILLARPKGTLVVVLALLLAPACAPSRDLPLLRLEGVAPARVHEGRALVVRGAGFPPGRRGTMTLRGKAYVPGGRARSLEVSREAIAISATEARVEADDALFALVGGRISFEGRVTLAFPAREGGTVSGALDEISLDFLPDTAARLAYDLGDTTRGRVIAERIGVRIAEEEPEEGGLVVAQVIEGSAASRIGLREGDRIVSMDGVRLFTLADLLPPPGIHETELSVVRGEDLAPVSVRLPLFVASDAPSPFILGLSIVLGLGLVVLLLASPAARLVDLLVEPSPTDPEATLPWLFGAQRGATGGVRTLATLLFGVLGMSLAFVGIAAITRHLEQGFGASILLSTALVLRLAAKIVGDDVPDDEDKLVALFAIGTPLALVITSVSLLTGTGHLSQIESAQGPYPWQWLVFEQPIAFALFPVFAATALGRVEPRGTKSRVAQILARAHLLVVSALGAVAFLGGTAAPELEGVDPRLLGLGLYVAKCWALIALGLWARSVSRFGGGNVWKWAVPTSVLGVLASLVWIVARVPATVEAASGPVLAGASLTVMLFVLVARLRAKEPRLGLSPFL